MGDSKRPIIIIVTIVAVLLAAVVIYKTANRSTGYVDENKADLATATTKVTTQPIVDNSGRRGDMPQSLPLPASKGGGRSAPRPPTPTR